MYNLSEVFVSKSFFRSCFFFVFFLWVYMLSGFFSGTLCLSEFWVSECCFRSFGQMFQGLNVSGFLWV